MSDNIRMDSHKLIYHVDKVSRWIHGENIYPIEVEIGPSGACNHRCVFCALDYLGYETNFLDKDVVLNNIGIMAEHGLKSVVCAGEGEPLLNKDLPSIVSGIKKMGVDVAMSSNGVLLSKAIIEECLSDFTWIRFSIASVEEDSYQRIHRSRTQDLSIVLDNLQNAVDFKRRNGLKVTLGGQCLLLKDNVSQIIKQAKTFRDIGLDYFTVKPYSHHKLTENSFDVDYKEMLDIERDIKQYETNSFKVYFRANAMRKIHEKKPYDECYALPFMTVIDSKGDVWPCHAHVGIEQLCYGNIYRNTFEEIWESKRRQEVVERLRNSDLDKICFEACRMDDMNKYLNELKHPGDHVNFI